MAAAIPCTVRLSNIVEESYSHLTNGVMYVTNVRLPGTPLQPVVDRVVKWMTEHSYWVVGGAAGMHAFFSIKPLLMGSICGLVLTASGRLLYLRTFNVDIFRTQNERVWLAIAIGISHFVFQSHVAAFLVGVFAMNTLAFTPPIAPVRELVDGIVRRFIAMMLPTRPTPPVLPQ